MFLFASIVWKNIFKHGGSPFWRNIKIDMKISEVIMIMVFVLIIFENYVIDVFADCTHSIRPVMTCFVHGVIFFFPI